jgi:protocatechuate 3,4-dioxygenase beta subunit
MKPQITDPDGSAVGMRRRESLIIVGGIAGAALWPVARALGAMAKVNSADAIASAAATCVLTPEVTAGPFYIANHLYRRNVTENQLGIPLTLHLEVQKSATCTPIQGATLEIWHANALGVYSGYASGAAPGGAGGQATPTDKLTFLRGHQKTDASGRVVFDTIYPGWYAGRTPHIHLRVHVGGSTVHTGQLFFADSISDAVYRTAHYRGHGQPDTTNAADSIYKQAGGTSALVRLSKQAGARGYLGAKTLGVKA